MKTKKINLVKNGIKIIINVKSDVEITSIIENYIYKALCNALWYEDDIKGLIALDTPINKYSTYWLENIESNVLYGEYDKILSIDIKCTLFDNGKLPDMQAIKESKTIAELLLN